MNKLTKVGTSFFFLSWALYVIPSLIAHATSVRFSSTSSHGITFAILVSTLVSAICLSASKSNGETLVEIMIILDVLVFLAFLVIGFI